jgi:8-oxo-dGTP diphosphatase
MQTVLVAAAVVVEDARVLLTRRKPGTHLAGAWEFPGGKVEPGEDPRAALVRELGEELGIDVSVGEIVDVTFHRYGGESSAQPGGKDGMDRVDRAQEKAVLLLFFEATRAPHSPEPRAIDVAAVRWASAGELDPALFPAADVSVLRKVEKRLASSRDPV